MNALSIVQRVYARLGGPSQQSLPYQQVLQTVADAIARKRLDLALSTQNSLATTSDWFTPSSTDFPLEDLGLEGGVLLPVRVERRAVDSEYEIGAEVPIVNYEVLNTSLVGGISFYGDPLRMAFRDELDYVTQQQYRIVYESDFETSFALTTAISLPRYFSSMVELEAAWDLLDFISDESPEWTAFQKRVDSVWPLKIADHRAQWMRFVRLFKGKAQIPKRTFLDNRCVSRPRFRGNVN